MKPTTRNAGMKSDAGQCFTVTDRKRKLENQRTDRDADAQCDLLKSACETGRLTHFRLINLSDADRVNAGKLQ